MDLAGQGVGIQQGFPGGSEHQAGLWRVSGGQWSGVGRKRTLGHGGPRGQEWEDTAVSVWLGHTNETWGLGGG